MTDKMAMQLAAKLYALATPSATYADNMKLLQRTAVVKEAAWLAAYEDVALDSDDDDGLQDEDGADGPFEGQPSDAIVKEQMGDKYIEVVPAIGGLTADKLVLQHEDIKIDT